MNLGDRVRRNPRYTWCICRGYKDCWCGGPAPFTIEAVDRTQVCQSGVMVIAARGARLLEMMDSAYFLDASGKERMHSS